MLDATRVRAHEAAEILNARRDAYRTALAGHGPSGKIAKANRDETTADLKAWRDARKAPRHGAIWNRFIDRVLRRSKGRAQA